LHGVEVDDPYRWMENLGDPAVQGWFKAQNEYARSVLAGLPGRAELARRIAGLSEAGTVVYDVVHAGTN
jgi:prolyl oligopeptidase